MASQGKEIARSNDLRAEKRDATAGAVAPSNKKTEESDLKEEIAAVEALMLDSNDILVAAGVSTPVSCVDKTVADLCGEQWKGGLTIVHANCRNSDESARVMQAVTAVSHNNGPLSALGIKHVATRVLKPDTNDPRTNALSETKREERIGFSS